MAKTKAKALRLKVYGATLGFYDTVVAAQNQGEALKAWGVRQNLFAEGAAQTVEDAAALEAALAHPGQPLRRPAGSDKPFALDAERPALPPGPKGRRPRRPAADRSSLDAAEAALERLEQDRRAEEAELAEARDALEARTAKAREAYAERRQAARAALADARAAYRKSGGKA